MTRLLAIALFPILFLTLAGCGADVASTAATEAALKAKEVKEAKKTEDQVVQKIDAANLEAQKRLEDADKAANQ